LDKLGKNGGMKKYTVTLTVEEIEQLQALSSKGKHAAQKILNALILLNCDESQGAGRRRSQREIAEVLKVSERKIERVKQRFVEDGLEMALNGQTPQREYEHKVDGDLEAQLIALSCSAPPSGHARWSLRLLAQRAVELAFVGEISHETVRRTLKKTNSSPGRRWVG